MRLRRDRPERIPRSPPWSPSSKAKAASITSPSLMPPLPNPAPQQYIAPFAGMAMAEEWMEKGKDVLIVFDDLSKHAVAYRTLSLLFAGPRAARLIRATFSISIRDSLERACKLAPEYGGGSITGCRSSKPKRAISAPIFRPTSFPSPMAKSSSCRLFRRRSASGHR
jgi:hypothetical protein